MVMQNPSAKAATVSGRIGKKVEKDCEKQITAMMISDRRTDKKVIEEYIKSNSCCTFISNYMSGVCQQKNAMWSEGRKASLQEKVKFLVRLAELG